MTATSRTRRKHYHLTELRPLDPFAPHEKRDLDMGPWQYKAAAIPVAVRHRWRLKAAGIKVLGDIHVGDYVVTPAEGEPYRLRVRGCWCEAGQAALKEIA